RRSSDRVGTEEDGRSAHVGRRLLEHPQPFAAYGGFKILETADIPSWSRKADNKTAADWVRDLSENDWNRVGQPMQLSQGCPTRDHDQIRCKADQFCRRGLFTIDITGDPAILNPHVAAIGPAQPLQRVAERCDASLTFAIRLRVED